jgi:hypothetical protein
MCGGDHDDAAAAAGEHTPADGLTGCPQAAQVGCDHPVPLGQRQLLTAHPLLEDPGIRDEHLDGPEFGCAPLDRGLGRIGVGHVTGDGEGRTAGLAVGYLLGHGLQCAGIAAKERHCGADFGQHDGGAAADAPSAAGDDCRPARHIQLEEAGLDGRHVDLLPWNAGRMCLEYSAMCSS